MAEVPDRLILLVPCLWTAIAALAYAATYQTLPKTDRLHLLQRVIWAVVMLSALSLGGAALWPTATSYIVAELPDPGG